MVKSLKIGQSAAKSLIVLKFYTFTLPQMCLKLLVYAMISPLEWIESIKKLERCSETIIRTSLM